MRLSANVGETFALLRSQPIYNSGTGLWSLYDFDAAGYTPGDLLNNAAFGALYFYLTSQTDESIPTVTVGGVDKLAYQLPFALNTTIDTQGDLYFESKAAMQGIMFNYEIKYVNSVTAITVIEKGEFYFN